MSRMNSAKATMPTVCRADGLSGTCARSRAARAFTAVIIDTLRYLKSIAPGACLVNDAFGPDPPGACSRRAPFRGRIGDMKALRGEPRRLLMRRGLEASETSSGPVDPLAEDPRYWRES